MPLQENKKNNKGKLIYLPIRKAFKKKKKHVEALQSLDVNNWQIEPLQTRSIEDIFSTDLLNQEGINELRKLLET